MRSILSAKFYQLWIKDPDRDGKAGEFDDGIDVPAWVAYERSFMRSESNQDRNLELSPLDELPDEPEKPSTQG